MERVLTENEKKDDYLIFTPEERKKLIIEYIKFIRSELGYGVDGKIMAAPSLAPLVSFRAMFVFNKQLVGGTEVRKHTCFFEARNYTDFSLKKFKEDVVDSTNIDTVDDFKKALRTRIWNAAYTDEEILCALFPRNRTLTIADVVVDGKLVIPPSCLGSLFNTLNIMGGITGSNVKVQNSNKPKGRYTDRLIPQKR